MQDQDDNINKFKEKCENTIEAFKSYFNSALPGNFDIKLISSLEIKNSDGNFRLKEIANLSAGQNRLEIKPYDKSFVKPIEQALWQLQLGTVAVDGSSIYLNSKLETQESKMKLIKAFKESAESYKKTLRSLRQDVLDLLKVIKKTHEDLFKTYEKKVQVIIDKNNEEIDKLVQKYEIQCSR